MMGEKVIVYKGQGKLKWIRNFFLKRCDKLKKHLKERKKAFKKVKRKAWVKIYKKISNFISS